MNFILRLHHPAACLMAYLRAINDPGVFCDTTVFSDFSTTSSESFELMTADSSQAVAVEAKRALPRGLKGEGLFPALPPCINFSALRNPKQFDTYIKAKFPLALTDSDGIVATTRDMNAPAP